MDDPLEEAGQELEQNYVRQTYDCIATDFSSTRYKKWPKVENFIKSLPENCLLLDVGCGNGKYLDSHPVFSIGCDISQKLLSICKDRGFEVVLCDMTRLPFRENIFDAVICVAALHHVASARRRQKCLDGIVKTMSVDLAQLLVQVWSYEQEIGNTNPYLREKIKVAEPKLREELKLDGGLDLPIHINRTPFLEQDLLVPFHIKSDSTSDGDKKLDRRHLRYYHVFKEKELDGMFEDIRGVKIEDSYYDRGNWCIIAKSFCKEKM